MKIVEKFNKLQLDGKLPHIVETAHLNKNAVKADVITLLKTDPAHLYQH